MKSKRLPLLLIFFTVFIDLVGFGIIIPILPLYADNFGASPKTIGWLVGIYSAMQFLFAPLFGTLSDRIGRRPVLIVSLIGTSVGFFLMGWAQSVVLLFLGRIIDGISGGNISTAQAYIADVTSKENRSRAMGLIGVAFGLGFIFGPLIGGLMSQISYSAPFYLAGGMAACNAILVFFFLPETRVEDRQKNVRSFAINAEFFESCRKNRLFPIIGSYFFLITGFSIMTALFALYTKRRLGYDVEHSSYLFAFIGFIAAFIQGGLLGRLVKMFGEKKLVLSGAFIMAVALFVMPLTHSFLPFILVCTGLAVGNSLMTPSLNGLASRSSDEQQQGRVLGIMQSAGSLGRFIGPALGGWLVAFDGNVQAAYGRTPLWVSSGILLVAMVCAWKFSSSSADVEETGSVPSKV